MTSATPPQTGKKRKPRTKALIAIIALVALGAAGYYGLYGRGTAGVSKGTTFKVARGPLDITVVEGGNIAALKSLQLKSEVQGETKILSIVEEGYLVTPEDVAKGLVLISLDSKTLDDRLTEQQLTFESTQANFTQAKEDFEIMITQNQSDISAAELAVKFAKADFEKYLGKAVAEEIYRLTDVEKKVLSDPGLEQGGSGEPGEVAIVDGEEDYANTATLTGNVDFRAYAKSELLGDGSAQQTLRTSENNNVLAQQELEAAQNRVNGTQRLFDKDFVTRLDLERDQLDLKRAQIKLASTETERDLFVNYDFPKTAETNFANYAESLRKLERARRAASAKLAQASARLKSADSQFALQKRKKEELEEQIKKCTMHATQPGLVVYGDGDDDYWRDNNRIEEGSSVRERQVIITIPDTTVMTVEVKVHESKVKSVQLGQRAKITVDAFPGRPLEGEVTRIGVLPDSGNRWMNPDLKVYRTTIRINGMHDWLKPGMTAESEILIKKIDDAVYVPLQAVTPTDTGYVCYVNTLQGQVERPVEVGDFNDIFIEIKNGVKPGDTVLLRAPVTEESVDKKGKPGEDQEEKKEEEKVEATTEQPA